MYRNITIVGTGKYVPNNKVYNEHFIKHFDKLGMSSESLMNHAGRRKRYLASENETSLSMGYESAKDALEKTNVSAKEIDMVIFVSDTPEYLMPTNAMKIVNMIEADNVVMCYDMNSNCSGLLVAMDSISSYMQTKPNINKVMIVSCFCISRFTKETDTLSYTLFADAAVSIILEAKEEEEKRGLLDSATYIDSSYHNTMTLPKCGFSKLSKNDLHSDEKKLNWVPFQFDFCSEAWSNLIKTMLKRNNLTPQDIDYYIFTQMSDPDNLKTLDKLGLGEAVGKYFFLGKEYGYTGVTCPGLALNRMWNMIAKKGNRIVFISAGAGVSIIVQYYQF